MSLTIRSARPADSALIFALVGELADYEKLTAAVDATPEQIAAVRELEQVTKEVLEKWKEMPAAAAAPAESTLLFAN